MSPERLVGIYLVGGSSRIPLIATLIAENLRVVPTSLDQPETAVALGAHHVPQEGITLRTSDISNTIEDVQRTRQVVAPRAGGFNPGPPPPPPTQGTPAQNPYPNSGPQQRVQGPPSTPTPMPAMVAQPGPSSLSGPAPQPYAPQRQRSNGSSNKGWYIATAVVAVVVIAVVSIIIATSGDSGGGGGNVAGADCSDRTADKDGLSECMRKVAGKVAENNTCTPGATGTGEEPIETPGATAATCTIDSTYSVMYMHFGGSDAADGSKQSGTETAGQYVETLVKQLKNLGSGGDPKTGSWDGDGLSGDYSAIDIAGGSGMLVFGVSDSPVAGVLIKIDIGGSDSLADLVDYFDQHIKPGGDGGA
jgi:hypothetical protein